MTPKTIITEVAGAYGITADTLLSRNRLARVADARAVACYLLYRHTRMSTTEIGAYIRRNHAAVLHNIRKAEGFFLFPKMYAVDLRIINDIQKKYFNEDA